MEAIVWALNARRISNAAWKVNVMLARRVGKNGFDVWPSHKRLSEDTELSVSTVRRALSELNDNGYIKIVPRLDAAGDRTSNAYRLQVRTKIVLPDEEIEIDADDIEEDDDPDMDGGLVNLNGPPVQNEQTGLFTGEQGSIPVGTYSNEEPPLPTGEDTPFAGNLFGEQLPAIIEPDLVDQVFEAWNQLAADIPAIGAVEVLSDSRRKKIVARGKEGKTPTRTPWQAWQQVFAAIRASTFLCGEEPPGKDFANPMHLTLDFALQPSKFLRILEGGYRANRSDLTHDPITGRRYGPSEQAGRATLAGIRANDDQRPDRGDRAGGAQAAGRGGAPSGPLRSAFDQYRIDDTRTG